MPDSADIHDWAGRPVHDGDPAHRITTRAIRKKIHRDRLAEYELNDDEKAVLRAHGEDVFGTCPVCGRTETKLVVTNGREHCGSCPWEALVEAGVSS
jgi:hypothetical protein